jgi:hypothetical protein
MHLMPGVSPSKTSPKLVSSSVMNVSHAMPNVAFWIIYLFESLIGEDDPEEKKELETKFKPLLDWLKWEASNVVRSGKPVLTCISHSRLMNPSFLQSLYPTDL